MDIGPWASLPSQSQQPTKRWAVRLTGQILPGVALGPTGPELPRKRREVLDFASSYGLNRWPMASAKAALEAPSGLLVNLRVTKPTRSLL